MDPTDADGLLDEIAAGLQTFTLDGEEPAVARVERVREHFAGPVSPLLPDLVVCWSDRPSRAGELFRSPEFGSIQRVGIGSGRSGNHTGEAWALVRSTMAPGAFVEVRDLGDIAATALARFGLDAPGTPLIACRS